MDGAGDQRRARLRRVRWRLRGALLWPAFAVATLIDASIMHWLPIAGEGTRPIAALLLAGCLNVAAVALLGGIGGLALRRLRPGLPKVVADDRAGTTALGLLAATYLVAGLVHGPQLDVQRAAFSRQKVAVGRWLDAHGDRFARAHVGLADSVRIDEDLYRTCVPRPAAPHYDCLIVDTSVSPPRVTPDAGHEANSSLKRW